MISGLRSNNVILNASIFNAKDYPLDLDYNIYMFYDLS